MPSLAGIERIVAAMGVELLDLFFFRERETPRDRAVERLLGVVRQRSAEDIVECVLRRWG